MIDCLESKSPDCEPRRPFVPENEIMSFVVFQETPAPSRTHIFFTVASTPAHRKMQPLHQNTATESARRSQGVFHNYILNIYSTILTFHADTCFDCHRCNAPQSKPDDDANSQRKTTAAFSANTLVKRQIVSSAQVMSSFCTSPRSDQIIIPCMLEIHHTAPFFQHLVCRPHLHDSIVLSHDASTRRSTTCCHHLPLRK